MRTYFGNPAKRRRHSVPARVTARLAGVLALAVVVPAIAQTNTLPPFQGFSPGVTVRVRSDKPPIDLAHAFFQSQTASNITVTSRGDRYCLDKSTVTLSPSEPKTGEGTNAPASVAKPTGAAATLSRARASGGNADADLLTTLRTVRESVLGDFGGDPGYGKASQFYDDTMWGVLSGKVGLDDLAKQAEEVLKQVDQYQPERAKDPRFETPIAQLRDFLARVHQGERIVNNPGKVE
jgi:hypothetical protein